MFLFTNYEFLDIKPNIMNIFLDVFLEDLPGCPSSRIVDFGGFTRMPFISDRRNYKIYLTKELKAQLQDLLDKGFIHPGVYRCYMLKRRMIRCACVSTIES